MWHISALSRTDDEMVGGPIVMVLCSLKQRRQVLGNSDRSQHCQALTRLRQFENTLRVTIPTLRCMGIVVEIAAHPH